MKSHTAADIKCGVEHGWPADDRYYSRADLIAAGCLVPVPDGEAMGVWDAGFLRYFQCDHPGVWRLQGCSMNHMAPCQIKNISDGTVTEIINNTIVQPVRLVRLEDLG